MLVRLIYYSTVGKINGFSEINEILEKSKRNNAELSITGMLYFDEKYFLQVLEGDRKNVSDLMFKIAKDVRHSDIVIVNITEINKRKFHKWNMVYSGGLKIDNEALLQFSPMRKFDPEQLSQDNFEALIDYIYSNLTK